MSKHYSEDFPRTYKRSSSFQVTLFTYLLFFVLLGSCLLTLGLLLADRDASTYQPWLDAEIDNFLANQCTPKARDNLWIEPIANSSASAAPKVIKRGVDSVNFLAATVSCDQRHYLVGIDVDDHIKRSNMEVMLLVMDVVVIVILMVVMFLIGLFVVRGTNNISSTAKKIMATGDLSQRIDVESRWDDLSYSAATVNELLARIEELMDGVKRVSDGIAHDLRTPLTRLRNQVDDLYRQTRLEPLEPVIEEIDQLIRTFNSLLRISRIETEQRRTHFGLFNLKELLDDVANFYLPVMEDKGIHLDHHQIDATINGDRDLIFQAIVNVLDNAIKFTPEGGQIQLRCENVGRNTIVSISDTGGGIPEEHIAKVLQRFYRADASRNPEGTGLGLALVNAIVQLHKGDIQLHNDNLGLRVSIKLPKASRR